MSKLAASLSSYVWVSVCWFYRGQVVLQNALEEVSTAANKFTEFATSFFGRKKLEAIPPSLTNAKRFPHGAFKFQITLTPEIDVELQASTDLRTWTTIASENPKSTPFEYLDSQAWKFPFRFYRAVSGGLMSVNVLGYASVSMSPGFSLIANPFNAPSNSLSALLADMPNGTVINKFDSGRFRMVEATFSKGQWSSPSEPLLPGEGAIISNPTQDFKTLDFVGDVPLGTSMRPVQPGLSVRSSLIPKPGRLDADLHFPLTEGDTIHTWDRDKQKYIEYVYPSKAWDTNPPIIGVGESFWIAKSAAGNWIQKVEL